jgi:hypothetical protein
MGKEKVDKTKKKCCGKFRKKNTYCTRCPVKIRLQCQLKRRIAEMGKKKDDKKKDKKKAEKKAAKKACCKKSCKKKSSKKKGKKK